jgi:mono/diheme cytochrome c family protein
MKKRRPAFVRQPSGFSPRSRESEKVRLSIGLFSFASLALFATASLAAERFDLPKGPGRDLVYGHCQTCHDLQSVEDSAGIRKGAWAAVLDNMKGFGLRITGEQHDKILDYLGTYLGPNPPAEQTAAAPAAAVDGAEVFDNTCIACHEADGQGKPGEFPPLAGNKDLFLSSEFPAAVVLNGITGPIEVEGKPFDNTMPPFDFLADEEIAAVLGYVRAQWGNDKLQPADFPAIDAAAVADLRNKDMSAGQVHQLRQSLGGK